MESTNRPPFSLKDDLSPSLRWYGLAILVMLAGLGFLYQFAMTGFDRINASLVQCKSGSICEVYLTTKGQHGIYQELSTVFGDKPYRSTLEESEGLAITVSRNEDSFAVPLKSFRGAAPYSLFWRDGVALFAFDVEKTGLYTVTVAPSPAGEDKPLVVAITGLNPSYELTSILLDGSLIFMMIGSVAAAIWATVYQLRKRNKARKHWSHRGSPKGNAGKPAEQKPAPAPVAVESDTVIDLRPNGKKKKRKK
ncbi:MAG: hypothetical protein HQK87_02240 [Nitrospinae bacterium]|nr:hypothetical protein [Nitrospinota bacterium]